MAERSSCFLLLLLTASLASCVPAGGENEFLRRITRQQPVFGITHLDIRDAIMSMERSIKEVTTMLHRQEGREAKLAASSTKTLGDLTQGVAEGGAGVQALTRKVATMEERLVSMEALLTMTDERQRMLLGQITEGLDRLLARQPSIGDFPGAPPPSPAEEREEEDRNPQQDDSAVLKVIKKLNKKLSGVESLLQRGVRGVKTEVTSVGASLEQHMRRLNGRQDILETRLEDTRNLTQTSFQHLTDTLTASTTDIKEQVMSNSDRECSRSSNDDDDDDDDDDAGLVLSSCMEEFTRHSSQQEETLATFEKNTQRALDEHLATLHTVLLETYAGQTLLNTSVTSLSQALSQVNTNTQNRLAKVTSEVIGAVKTDTEAVVGSLREEMSEGNTNIMDMLDDRASQTENLHDTVLENYSQLSEELKGLKKVEQVMLHTADSVLDTRRSIEFGIQQIILELGDLVKNIGSTINTTLYDQINGISLAILNNQTSALTNMTAKMEQEISQVWRQIGVMYQQMSQSVDLLDQLKDTTKEHMNASLSRVGNMDGTVGKINTKVADVESNLNYLLGRLSLVVSEFNLMKTGVGEELMRLRDRLARDNQQNGVEFAEGSDPLSSRYNVNRKRELLPEDAPSAGVGRGTPPPPAAPAAAPAAAF